MVDLKDGKFIANRQPFLIDVPSNVVVTPTSNTSSHGCFVGFDSEDSVPKSWHTASLGRLVGIPFMSIFRFKVWWTTQWIGTCGRDIENETQFLLLDKSDTDDVGSFRPYVLLLPIIDGRFRASLRSGVDDNVDVCVESGSTLVTQSSFRTCVYIQVATSDDPFLLVKDAMKVVRDNLGTTKLLSEKTPPPIVDRFGWCTWDAFYLKVKPSGVIEGVKTLTEGGCPPGLVIIDDGWQTILHDSDTDESSGMARTSAGEQMPCRLIKYEENQKFKSGGDDMSSLTKELRARYGVQHIYVWHALCGYWGGVRPMSKDLPDSVVVAPVLTPGLELTMEDLAVDKIVNNGVGLVLPEKITEFYENLHSHLASVGIDGVKVDVIHLLEMLCENYGGRVDLARAYYKALSASVDRHFAGNGVIASMEHCNDFMLLGTESISLGRVGDDFWCTDPAGDSNGTFWLQGCHMAHCAYNSLWMGNFIHPDWDMFQSTHPCAEFHAASRAISGGPIYVSDGVGQHDFDLLKSLALPDGSILRCAYYALPTRDCLFSDPLHDGKTMLKIWNVNLFTGVLGIFNCQGGGWNRETRRNESASEHSHLLTGRVSVGDVEWGSGEQNDEEILSGVKLFAVYWFRERKVKLMEYSDSAELLLKPFEFELLTVSPVKSFSSSGSDEVGFAAIGLVNMLNSGGAIQSLLMDGGVVHVGVKGAGELKAFSSMKPIRCKINGSDVEFLYEDNLVSLNVPWAGSSEVEIVY